MTRNPLAQAHALDEAGAGLAGIVSAGDRAAAGGELELHVPDLLPGERAEVAIEHRSRQRPMAWARIVARVGEPSAERVAPACPGFGGCGGCAWQHLAYPAQLEAKRARIVAAVPGVEVAAVTPSPAQLGYRNKGKYVVAASGRGLVLGAYAPRSHKVIDTAGCRVVAPVIDEVAGATRVACDAAGLHAYDEQRGKGELRYVVVRADAAGGALVVLVVTSATRGDRLAEAAAAIATHAAVRGVIAMRNDRKDGAIVTGDATVLAGAGVLVEDVAGCPVEVGAGEFLQVNRDQARAIYDRVAALALAGVDGAPRALDLYSGLGGIALTLARRGAHVTAVEVDPSACAALRRAADTGGLGDRVTVVTSDAGAAQLPPADVVVVNPPRKGLSAAARAALLALAPGRILYVSCGPDSLGRDLAALTGYRPGVVEPFDLMPGTAQIESLVPLDRT